MADYVEISWTSGSLEEARQISRYLVQERHVACAQIIPWIESVYMWDNKLETTQESKVVMKSRTDKIDTVVTIIQQNCKYEVPEITWKRIDGGNKEYLEWVEQSTPNFAKN